MSIVAVLLVSACGSDDSDGPSTTVDDGTSLTTPGAETGGGVPLEPGSNLPPTDSDGTTPSGTIGDPLAPSVSLVEPGD